MVDGGARELPSGDVCFLFTDVEASTAILRQVGDTVWAKLQDQMHAIIRAAVESNSGTLVNTEGDGCFAAFNSGPDAARACAEAQAELRDTNWGAAREVRVRMGLHAGTDIVPTGNDYVAMAVHRAARVTGAAHGGQVLATSGVVEECAADDFADLGLFTIRDFDGPVRLFALVQAGVASAPPRVPPAFDQRVPQYRTAMVGRDAEMAGLLAELDHASVVTLVGPPGVGKTRLAVAALAQLAGTLSVGPWFVDLTRAGGPITIGDVISLAVGCPPDVELDAHLDAMLDDRRGILVLDHCDELLDSAAATADLMRVWNPSLQILATSKQPLGLPGELVFELEPMELPTAADEASILSNAAGRLFLERASRVAPQLELTAESAHAVYEVCHAIDGVPLALELASALVTDAEHGAPSIHQLDRSLASLIGLSLDRLPALARRAAGALTVIGSPASPRLVAAALSAVGIEAAAAADVLDLLIRRGLLDLDGNGDYVQLTVISRHAGQLSDVADHQAVVDALLTDCLAATAEVPVPASKHDQVAFTATMLVYDDALAVRDRQLLAARLAPWWQGRLGGKRARTHLTYALSLGSEGSVAAALHLAIADTYPSGTETGDTEQHIYDAVRLLGELDAVDPALVARLQAATARETAAEPES